MFFRVIIIRVLFGCFVRFCLRLSFRILFLWSFGFILERLIIMLFGFFWMSSIWVFFCWRDFIFFLCLDLIVVVLWEMRWLMVCFVRMYRIYVVEDLRIWFLVVSFDFKCLRRVFFFVIVLVRKRDIYLFFFLVFLDLRFF